MLSSVCYPALHSSRAMGKTPAKLFGLIGANEQVAEPSTKRRGVGATGEVQVEAAAAKDKSADCAAISDYCNAEAEDVGGGMWLTITASKYR